MPEKEEKELIQVRVPVSTANEIKKHAEKFKHKLGRFLVYLYGLWRERTVKAEQSE